MTFLSTLLGSNVVLGLVAALTWGGGDFAGGMGVRRAGGSFSAALRVVLLSHTVSVILLCAFAFLHHAARPGGAPLYWSLLAGAFGGVSVLSFYVCLARGDMGSSAAISGLLAAAIPSIVSTALEGAPLRIHLAGFLLAASAIWLVAASADGASTAPGTVFLSALSGTGFGLYFVALRMAGSAGIVWPLALCRGASITICLLSMLFFAWRSRGRSRQSPSPEIDRVFLGWILATALLDTSGNLFYIAATRLGRLDVAAVLASLYPASTILLAARVLKERPTVRQRLGMVVALAAVVLITV